MPIKIQLTIVPQEKRSLYSFVGKEVFFDHVAFLFHFICRYRSDSGYCSLDFIAIHVFADLLFLCHLGRLRGCDERQRVTLRQRKFCD
jgi:hypothetical protein